jgi:probable HAF family extracellular repeat protein
MQIFKIELIIMLVFASLSNAGTQYCVSDIGDFYPQVINNRGTVAGNTRSTVNGSIETEPYIFSNGVGTAFTGFPVPPPGYVWTNTIVSLNNSDVAIVSGEGVIQNLTFSRISNYSPYAINDKGQILAKNVQNDFMYILGNTNQIIGSSSGGIGCALNNNGDALFTLSDDPTTGATTLQHNSVVSAINGRAFGINDSCHYVGLYPTNINSFSANAFYYNGVSRIDIGSFGGTFSIAHGINSLDQIVGGSNLSGDAVEHAFIYQNSQLTDLNTLIPSDSGWVLNGASAINDNGWIVGRGVNPQGQQTAYLLQPIPEPWSILNLATLFALYYVSRVKFNLVPKTEYIEPHPRA